MQGRYNKTARILKMELRVSVKKTEIQDYLHWVVQIIEIIDSGIRRIGDWGLGREYVEIK